MAGHILLSNETQRWNAVAHRRLLVLLTKDLMAGRPVRFSSSAMTPANAEVALHLPTATWHAYNHFGGESLYASTHGLSGGHARKVSLDRPITRGFGIGTKFLFEEHEGVMWLEDHGL